MEKRLRRPDTPLTAEPGRRSRLLPRVLLALGVLLVVAGAVGVPATVWPRPAEAPQRRARRPAPAATGAAGALSAVAAWERGDFAEALRYDEAALRRDGGQREALAGRARTLASLGRTAQARAAYRTALGSRPSPDVLLELGELYESAGEEAQAAAQYAYHRGAIELALDRSGPARRHLELALRTNPAFSPLWAPAAREALTDLGDPPLTAAPTGAELTTPTPPPTARTAPPIAPDGTSTAEAGGTAGAAGAGEATTAAGTAGATETPRAGAGVP